MTMDIQAKKLLDTFAAARRTEMDELARLLRPEVHEALRLADDEERTVRLLEAAQAAFAVALGDFDGDQRLSSDEFINDLQESIELLEPDGTQAQEDRLVNWLATAAMGGASYATSNPTWNKTWVTMRDEDVRDTHEDLHGESIPVDDLFTVNTDPPARPLYPGQPVGPVEAWINCRCVMMTAPPTVGLVSAAPTKPLDELDELDDEDDEEPPAPEELIDGRTDEEMEWHAVIAPIGSRSGDGRTFTELVWRDLPLPLEWQPMTAPHHDGSVIVGAQHRLGQVGNEVRASGRWVDNEHAEQVIGLIAEGAVRSVSVQIDDAMEMAAADDSGGVDYTGRICATTIVNVGAFPECWIKLGPPPDDFFDGEDEALAASCECEEFRNYDAATRKKMAKNGTAMPDGSFPIADREDLANAIQSIGRAKNPDAARRHIRKRAKALGAESMLPDTWALAVDGGQNSTDNGTVEAFRRGAGWVTHPKETRRLHHYWTKGKGALKIRWGQPGDFNRCRRQLAKYIRPTLLNQVCAQWHKDAMGIWPGEHRALEDSVIATAPISMLASATPSPLPPKRSWFDDQHLDGPTALTVDKRTGQLFGHIATWGQCHIGIDGECVEPPHSPTNYAYYHTGVVETDEGEIPCGVLTMNTGHADLRAGAKRAVAHYDDTGLQVARVRAGEDEFGIWVAGVADVMDEADFAKFRAAAISGDWRNIAGNLELVAGLAVNVPGYPVPRAALAASGGHRQALVAANVVTRSEASIIDVDAIAAAVVARLDDRQKRLDRLAALAPINKMAKQRRVDAMKALVEV